MGWSGRAPAPLASEAGPGGTKVKEHAMSQKLNSAITVIGFDIGNNSFHVVGHGRSHSEQKTSALSPQADVWAERGLVSATWPEPDIHGVGARALRPTSS